MQKSGNRESSRVYVSLLQKARSDNPAVSVRRPARKATCLWMRGVEKLRPTNIVEPVIIKYKNGKGTDNPWHMETMKLPPKERAKARSKTFIGIATAMAEQWSV